MAVRGTTYLALNQAVWMLCCMGIWRSIKRRLSVVQRFSTRLDVVRSGFSSFTFSVIVHIYMKLQCMHPVYYFGATLSSQTSITAT